YRQRLNETTGIQVGARLGADGHKRFGGLNRVSAGFETNLHFKPVPGYSKPWYRLHANIELSKFADSDLRDGLAGALVADVGLRLAPGLIGKAGYNFDWRRAFDGNVFDTSGHSLFASADYTLTSKVHLYSRYQARVGTVVSTASPSARLLANANAIEIDNTFGRSTNANFIGPPGQVGARPAYQLDAFSQSVRAGFNVALTHAMSLDLSAQWLTVDGRGGIDYRAWDFGGAILYRFR
ncbi:MAG: hypothetical protein HOI95_02830, partial [Chromatiales bacterium]|nr:hypothetical protein [Chromatiales bacterium]